MAGVAEKKIGGFAALNNLKNNNKMQKTLGGDRLGSGNKQKVHLHGFERSTNNMGYIFRSTMSSGTLVPYLCEIALPGDTFDIDLDVDVKTHPTIGPLFGSYKVQLDTFLAPIRLYNSALHNNKLNIGRNMSQVKLPQITLTAPALATDDQPDDIDNMQINPSSIMAYLGVRGIGITLTEPATRDFNAIPLLAYWEIYKNYYANKQEEIGAVIHVTQDAIVTTVDTDGIKVTRDGTPVILPIQPGSDSITVSGLPDGQVTIEYTGASPIPSQIMVDTSQGLMTLEDLAGPFVDDTTGDIMTGYVNYGRWGTIGLYSWRYRTAADGIVAAPQVVTFPLENIDLMREAILSSGALAQFIVNTAATAENLTPYRYLYEAQNTFPNLLSTQEGLGLKTYQSDLFNNWLKTEWIDGPGGITELTSIDTSSGSFSLDTFNISKKVYNMLNRIAVSGGSYEDWVDAVYTHDRYKRVESPMYMGGLIKELVFQEVVSNAENEGKPLGTLAGKGILAKKHKGGSVTIKVDEPSYVIGIISLTPRLDYSQGNKWDVHLKTMDDLHKPPLDEIGFQELITEQMAWWDTNWDETNNVWIQWSAGKQPAWINYRTNVNRTLGNFAIRDNEMFMTLNRRYESDGTRIVDLTTYIDPVKFNFIFAETALDAQNFWVQIAVDMTVRRKISARVMPNL